MNLMSWTGIGLGIIFGLPAAFFLLLLLRHVFRNRDAGGLRAFELAERSWLGGLVLFLLAELHPVALQEYLKLLRHSHGTSWLWPQSSG
jgi:hypothetical protein